MVTLHEVITFLVSMQISISSLQTHNVNRCGRSRHLASKLSLRRKRSSPNVFEMAATETITSIILIIQVRYDNHFYIAAHKFEQICRHRLRRQNVGYSNFSQPQSHLSFCVLLQYLVERRRVVTQLGKLD